MTLRSSSPPLGAAVLPPGALPLAQAGLIAFEIIPLAPYNGFARLME